MWDTSNVGHLAFRSVLEKTRSRQKRKRTNSGKDEDEGDSKTDRKLVFSPAATAAPEREDSKGESADDIFGSSSSGSDDDNESGEGEENEELDTTWLLGKDLSLSHAYFGKRAKDALRDGI
eukprot:g4264.t1